MTSRAPFAAWLVAFFALTATPCRAGQQPVAATASASEDPVAQMPKTNDPVRLTATVVTTEKRPSALLPLYVSLAALQVTDGVATQWGVNHGRVESNPGFRPFANTPAALWAVKGGVTVGTIYLTERMWRHGHRGAAIATMVVSNGILVAVTARNASVLRSSP